MQIEQRFFIGLQDAGPGDRIHNKAILEAMTNTANLHSHTIGQGSDSIAASRVTWMVTNWKLQVLRRPVVCDTITVRTWAQAYTRAQAHRDCEALDSEGRPVAIATSVWAAVNIDTGAVQRLTPEWMDGYGCEPEHVNFPGFRFPKTGDVEPPVLARARFTVTRSLIDCNNHVHNPAYLDIANEVLPPELDAGLFDNVEIRYKREIRPRETVSLEYAPSEEGKHLVFLRDPEDGGLHARVALW